MVAITESVLIDRSARDVFAYVSNSENDPDWRSSVTEMRHDPPGETHVGMRTHEVMRLMGKDIVNDAEIVEYEAGHKTAFRTTSGPLAASGYRLVEDAGDQTLFTYHVQADLGGLYELLSALIAWSFRRRVQADLRRLKELLDH